MAAVHQHRQLHGPGPAQVVQRIERGPHRPARIQHIVDQDNGLPVYSVSGKLGSTQRTSRVEPQIVPVHGDVQRTARDLEPLELPDTSREATRERNPAGRNAEQDDLITAVRPLQDLVRDPGERTPDLLGVEDRETMTPRDRTTGCAHKTDLLPRLSGRSLKDVYVDDHTGSYQRA